MHPQQQVQNKRHRGPCRHAAVLVAVNDFAFAVSGMALFRASLAIQRIATRKPKQQRVRTWMNLSRLLQGFSREELSLYFSLCESIHLPQCTLQLPTLPSDTPRILAAMQIAQIMESNGVRVLCRALLTRKLVLK